MVLLSNCAITEAEADRKYINNSGFQPIYMSEMFIEFIAIYYTALEHSHCKLSFFKLRNVML